MIYKVGRSFLQPAKENLTLLYLNFCKNQLLCKSCLTTFLDEFREISAKLFPPPEVLLCGTASKDKISP